MRPRLSVFRAALPGSGLVASGGFATAAVVRSDVTPNALPAAAPLFPGCGFATAPGRSTGPRRFPLVRGIAPGKGDL